MGGGAAFPEWLREGYSLDKLCIYCMAKLGINHLCTKEILFFRLPIVARPSIYSRPRLGLGE